MTTEFCRFAEIDQSFPRGNPRIEIDAALYNELKFRESAFRCSETQAERRIELLKYLLFFAHRSKHIGVSNAPSLNERASACFGAFRLFDFLVEFAKDGFLASDELLHFGVSFLFLSVGANLFPQVFARSDQRLKRPH